MQILLSYRRDDSEDIVGRIYDKLRQHFGSPHVFKCVDSTKLSVDFRHANHPALISSDVVLVAIGHNWLGIRPDGTRRLDNESDYVLLEIEAAIRQGKNVIPILIGDAQMPSPESLPSAILELAFRNAIRVRPDPDFHNDIERLIRALDDNTRAIRDTPAMSMRHQQAAMPLHMLIVAMFGLLALCSIGGGVFAIANGSVSETQLRILGAELRTGHVGVALVGIGFIITFFTVRAVLRSQRDLAALPSDNDT